MSSKKTLIISIIVSVAAHLFFGIGAESYVRFVRFVRPHRAVNEPVIRVVPVPPSGWKEFPAEPAAPRFLGPKNISPSVETAPKPQEQALSRKTVPAVPPLTPAPPVGAELKPDDKSRPVVKPGVTEKGPPPVPAKPALPASEPPKKTLPSLDRLVPKPQDMVTAMPKEQSLDMNRGTVKEGKELVLATKEFKYWSYLEKLKRKVELLWDYPDAARGRGLGGVLKIDFSIDRNGALERLALVDPSGAKLLDDAAVKALRDAAPFAPFPNTWDIERLNIQGTFIYEIKMVR